MKLTNEIIDGMTDEEIIEALATKLMGWHESHGGWVSREGIMMHNIYGDNRDWNPIKNINDYQDVLGEIDKRDLYWNRTISGHPNCVQCNLYDLWHKEGPRNDCRHGCPAALKAIL